MRRMSSKSKENYNHFKNSFSPSRKLRVLREKGVIQRIQEMQQKIFQDELNLAQLKLFPQVQEESMEKQTSTIENESVIELKPTITVMDDSSPKVKENQSKNETLTKKNSLCPSTIVTINQETIDKYKQENKQFKKNILSNIKKEKPKKKSHKASAILSSPILYSALKSFNSTSNTISNSNNIHNKTKHKSVLTINHLDFSSKKTLDLTNINNQQQTISITDSNHFSSFLNNNNSKNSQTIQNEHPKRIKTPDKTSSIRINTLNNNNKTLLKKQTLNPHINKVSKGKTSSNSYKKLKTTNIPLRNKDENSQLHKTLSLLGKEDKIVTKQNQTINKEDKMNKTLSNSKINNTMKRTKSIIQTKPKYPRKSESKEPMFQKLNNIDDVNKLEKNKNEKRSVTPIAVKRNKTFFTKVKDPQKLEKRHITPDKRNSFSKKNSRPKLSILKISPIPAESQTNNYLTDTCNLEAFMRRYSNPVFKTVNISKSDLNSKRCEKIEKLPKPKSQKEIFDLIDNEKVNDILSKLPERRKTTLDKFCLILKQKTASLSDEEKAWLIFRWLSENITFEIDSKDKTLNSSMNISILGSETLEQSVYKRGKSGSNGYPALFKYFSEIIGLISFTVNGYAKGYSFNPNVPFKRPNHIWNVVKLGKNNYVIDPSWAVGIMKDQDEFSQCFDPFYFCTSPSKFIRTHLPEDSKYQLLPTTYNMEQFMSMPKLSSKFYQFGFAYVTPDKAVLTESHGINRYTLHFEADGNNLDLAANLYYLQDDDYKQIENSTLIQKISDKFFIDVIFNLKGKYIIEFYAKTRNSKIYEYIYEYRIECTQDSENPISFPFCYNTLDIELIEPRYENMVQGTSINFKFRSSKITKMFIVMNDEWLQCQNEEDVFYYKDAYIHSEEISILYFDEKAQTNYTVYKYKTKKDTNNETTVSYPKCFGGVQSRLIEPKVDSVRKGDTVKFEVRCEEAIKMVIVMGDVWKEMSKDEGHYFSGEVLINEGSSVKLAYQKENTGLRTLYEYKIII